MLHKKGKNFEKVFGNFGKKIFFSEKMFLRDTFFQNILTFLRLTIWDFENFCLKRFFFQRIRKNDLFEKNFFGKFCL